MSLNVADDVAPDPATWAAIQKRLHKPVVTETMGKAWTAGILKCLGAAVVVLVVVSAFYWLQPSSQLNADYVAVLTDEAGKARLTAITGADGETLWLQWGHSNGAATDSLPQEASWQLWAVSRRDGESRTVALFEGSTPGQVLLTETTLRLIRDASHLVLTLEEEGGSAIDEPSDDVLARGECVRLQVSPS